MNSPEPSLFVYGTLRDTDILALALGYAPQHVQCTAATAPGFRTAVMPGQNYPALVAAAGQSATGLLLAGLSFADLAALDRFEGEEYRRATIGVESAAGASTAQTYLPTAEIAADAPSWTLEHWAQHHKSAMRLAEAARLSSVAAPDPFSEED